MMASCDVVASQLQRADSVPLCPADRPRSYYNCSDVAPLQEYVEEDCSDNDSISTNSNSSNRLARSKVQLQISPFVVQLRKMYAAALHCMVADLARWREEDLLLKKSLLSDSDSYTASHSQFPSRPGTSLHSSNNGKQSTSATVMQWKRCHTGTSAVVYVRKVMASSIPASILQKSTATHHYAKEMLRVKPRLMNPSSSNSDPVTTLHLQGIVSEPSSLHPQQQSEQGHTSAYNRATNEPTISLLTPPMLNLPSTSALKPSRKQPSDLVSAAAKSFHRLFNRKRGRQSVPIGHASTRLDIPEKIPILTTFVPLPSSVSEFMLVPAPSLPTLAQPELSLPRTTVSIASDLSVNSNSTSIDIGSNSPTNLMDEPLAVAVYTLDDVHISPVLVYAALENWSWWDHATTSQTPINRWFIPSDEADTPPSIITEAEYLSIHSHGSSHLLEETWMDEPSITSTKASTSKQSGLRLFAKRQYRSSLSSEVACNPEKEVSALLFRVGTSSASQQANTLLGNTDDDKDHEDMVYGWTIEYGSRQTSVSDNKDSMSHQEQIGVPYTRIFYFQQQRPRQINRMTPDREQKAHRLSWFPHRKSASKQLAQETANTLIMFATFLKVHASWVDDTHSFTDVREACRSILIRIPSDLKFRNEYIYSNQAPAFFNRVDSATDAIVDLTTHYDILSHSADSVTASQHLLNGNGQSSLRNWYLRAKLHVKEGMELKQADKVTDTQHPHLQLFPPISGCYCTLCQYLAASLSSSKMDFLRIKIDDLFYLADKLYMSLPRSTHTETLGYTNVKRISVNSRAFNTINRDADLANTVDVGTNICPSISLFGCPNDPSDTLPTIRRSSFRLPLSCHRRAHSDVCLVPPIRSLSAQRPPSTSLRANTRSNAIVAHPLLHMPPLLHTTTVGHMETISSHSQDMDIKSQQGLPTLLRANQSDTNATLQIPKLEPHLMPSNAAQSITKSYAIGWRPNRRYPLQQLVVPDPVSRFSHTSMLSTPSVSPLSLTFDDSYRYSRRIRYRCASDASTNRNSKTLMATPNSLSRRPDTRLPSTSRSLSTVKPVYVRSRNKIVCNRRMGMKRSYSDSCICYIERNHPISKPIVISSVVDSIIASDLSNSNQHSVILLFTTLIVYVRRAWLFVRTTAMRSVITLTANLSMQFLLGVRKLVLQVTNGISYMVKATVLVCTLFLSPSSTVISTEKSDRTRSISPRLGPTSNSFLIKFNEYNDSSQNSTTIDISVSTHSSIFLFPPLFTTLRNLFYYFRRKRDDSITASTHESSTSSDNRPSRRWRISMPSDSLLFMVVQPSPSTHSNPLQLLRTSIVIVFFCGAILTIAIVIASSHLLQTSIVS